MFCVAIESGLHGRGVKSIRPFCLLALLLPTQAVENLQGFYAFFLIEGKLLFNVLCPTVVP